MTYWTKPLNRKAYGHIPHLPGSRVGPADHRCNDGQAAMCCVKPVRNGDHVVVQEKLDGSCVAVARIGDDIVPLIRAGLPAHGSFRSMHHLFAGWALHHADRFRAVLQPGQRLVGEWLSVAHGTRYALPHEPFVVFDLMSDDKRIATALELRALVHPLGFVTPRVLHEGTPISIPDVLTILDPSGHGALEETEGAVWRVERDGGTVLLAKYVRPSKLDGKYFAEGIVWNTWPEEERAAAVPGAAEPRHEAVSP